MIDINTKFITLIGTPLSQSYAARMQNAGYVSNNLNYCYFYTEADSEHLCEIINGIRYMPSFAGCAVTKPNKVEVMKYLDEFDSLCEKIGSANTVVKTTSGKLRGYNTDGVGFLKALKEEGFEIKDKSFFCFGAGGVGRAICFSLAFAGASKVYITDVISESAQSLASDINKYYCSVACYVGKGDFCNIPSCDAVINATGIGMGKTIGESPLPKCYINSNQLFFDACYNPLKTQFLLDAENKGCMILNGLSMSLYQGVAQIELWTGQGISPDFMRNELSTIIEKTVKEKA